MNWYKENIALQECERLKEEIHHYEDQGLWIPEREEEARKQAAREIEQHLLSMFWTIPYKENEPMIYRDQAIELIRITFGLEG